MAAIHENDFFTQEEETSAVRKVPTSDDGNNRSHGGNGGPNSTATSGQGTLPEVQQRSVSGEQFREVPETHASGQPAHTATCAEDSEVDILPYRLPLGASHHPVETQADGHVSVQSETVPTAATTWSIEESHSLPDCQTTGGGATQVPVTFHPRPQSQIMTDRSRQHSRSGKHAKVPRRLKPSQGLQSQESGAHAMVPSPEELMSLIMFRYRREKSSWEAQSEELASLKRTLDSQADEIASSHQQFQQLRVEMQSTQQDYQLQSAELARHKKLGSTWKTKLHKLEDFIKGLTTDHHKLRDDVKSLSMAEESLRADKVTLDLSLKDAKSSLDQAVQRNKLIVVENRSRVEALQQTVQAHAHRIERDSALMSEMQTRNDSLIENLAQLARDRSQELGSTNKTMDEMLFKLTETADVVAEQKAIPQVDALKVESMLDHCMTSLKDILSMPSVHPDDLQKLDLAIGGCAKA